MNQREFVIAYALAASQGAASTRGGLRAHDIVEDGMRLWEAIEHRLPDKPARKTKANPAEE